MRAFVALIAVLAVCAFPAFADTISLAGEDAGGDAVITEVPRPATPPPATPTPAPRPAVSAGPLLAPQGNAGTIAFTVDFDGRSRLYQTQLNAIGDRFHGTLSANGTDAFGAPLGNVTVGDALHHASLGEINDPLSGVVIRHGAFDGIDVHQGGARFAFDELSGRRIDGSRFLGVQRSTSRVSDTIGVLGGGGTPGTALLRHEVLAPMSWGTLDAELLASTRGAAAGLEARTRGRTFLDATLTRALGTLPLQDGDLPASFSIGHALSPATTLSAGYAESQGASARGYLGMTTRVRAASFALNVAPGLGNLFVSTAGRNGFAQFYVSAGATTVVGMRGTAALRGLQLEVDGSHSLGVTTGSAQVRTTHPGLNLAAGIDVSGGAVAPLVGIVAAVSPQFALETALIRGNSGRPAVRLSIVAGVRAPAPRVAAYPLKVSVATPPTTAPLRLFVDGAARGTLRDGHIDVAVTAGRHDVYVASADGAYGSPEQTVLGGSDRTASLTLVPQRIVHGRVRLAGDRTQFPAELSLQGIRIVIAPGGASVLTDADGEFVFPRAPYDPSARVLVDRDTLPPGVRAPDGVAGDAAPELDLPLTATRSVERTVFP